MELICFGSLIIFGIMLLIFGTICIIVELGARLLGIIKDD